MQKIKDIVKMSDFFNSFHILRYKQEAEYRTFTGGLISVGVIITIIIAFASMILDTVNRVTISFSHRN
jgi:archaellum biogenesis protein FlaJ (TadC family)